MKRWAKIKNDKVIELGFGKNEKFYQKHGFQYIDVERSEKGGWWCKGAAPTFNDEEIIENEYVADKQIRDNEMATLTVEVDGYVFQADEESQNRMVRAILVLENKETIQWVTADDKLVMISREQLEQALRKAVEAQTEIWGKPHWNKYNKKHSQNKPKTVEE